MPEVHEDPYPSRFAMEAAVELEINFAIGRIQTQTVGKVIQRAIDKAFAASMPPPYEQKPMKGCPECGKAAVPAAVQMHEIGCSLGRILPRQMGDD